MIDVGKAFLLSCLILARLPMICAPNEAAMTITITAFERSPDGGKGLARDTRVRWALEEVGHPYEVRLGSFRAMKEPAHLALHPFGAFDAQLAVYTANIDRLNPHSSLKPYSRLLPVAP